MMKFTPQWGEPKRDLNKWQFAFQIFPDFMAGAGSRLIFGIFNLHTRPKRDEAVVRGEHYKGFLINILL